MTRVYEYDVFISYQRRGRDIPAWVRTHFHPRLLESLDNNLDRDARIFFDEQVPGGAIWPKELSSALQRTRILVPVCSPKYFVDEWCLAEWYSMADREELVGQDSRRLIYPVIFCDSENFPDYARQRQMRSLRRWNLPYPQFQDTAAYLDFHREIELIAEDLALLIDQAPEWQPGWPTVTPTPPQPGTPLLPRF